MARDPNKPRKHGGGAKLLLSDATARDAITLKITGALKAGATFKAAALFAGIGAQTYFEWLKRGRADLNAGGRRATSVFAVFVGAIDQAVAECEVRAVTNIAKAGGDPRFWAANAFLLERRDPKRWGQRRFVDTERTPDGGEESDSAPSGELDLSGFTVEELRELKRLQAKASRPAGSDPGTKP